MVQADEHLIETNEKVREKILPNYLVMKVTENADNTNSAFLSQYPYIPGYPHLFVLDFQTGNCCTHREPQS